jgi:hypothetical protein
VEACADVNLVNYVEVDGHYVVDVDPETGENIPLFDPPPAIEAAALPTPPACTVRFDCQVFICRLIVECAPTEIDGPVPDRDFGKAKGQKGCRAQCNNRCTLAKGKGYDDLTLSPPFYYPDLDPKDSRQHVECQRRCHRDTGIWLQTWRALWEKKYSSCSAKHCRAGLGGGPVA